MKDNHEQEKICRQFLISKMGLDYLENMQMIYPGKSMCDLVIDLFTIYSEEKTNNYAAEDFRDLRRVYPELASFIGSKIAGTRTISKSESLKILGI